MMLRLIPGDIDSVLLARSPAYKTLPIYIYIYIFHVIFGLKKSPKTLKNMLKTI
jgi:hypothetical protein